MVSLLTDVYALSLPHFPLPQFQRPRRNESINNTDFKEYK